MIQVNEKPISSLSDAFYGLHVEVPDLFVGRYIGQAVTVFDQDSDGCPGTLIYIPGVSAQDVKEDLTNA